MEDLEIISIRSLYKKILEISGNEFRYIDYNNIDESAMRMDHKSYIGFYIIENN